MAYQNGVKVPIVTKLALSFLLIIVLTSVILSVVGVQIIGHRVVAEAQEKVRTDLNSAREIYLNKLSHIKDVVRLTADRVLLLNALFSGNMKQAIDALGKIKEREGLDVLTITDKSGKVLLRTSNLILSGDDQGRDELVRAVIERKEPAAATAIIPAGGVAEGIPAAG